MRMKEDLIKRIENKEVQYSVKKLDSKVCVIELRIPVVYCGQCFHHHIDIDSTDGNVCNSAVKMICSKEHKEIISCLNVSDLEIVEIPSWCTLDDEEKEANG